MPGLFPWENNGLKGIEGKAAQRPQGGRGAVTRLAALFLWQGMFRQNMTGNVEFCRTKSIAVWNFLG